MLLRVVRHALEEEYGRQYHFIVVVVCQHRYYRKDAKCLDESNMVSPYSPI